MCVIFLMSILTVFFKSVNVVHLELYSKHCSYISLYMFDLLEKKGEEN